LLQTQGLLIRAGVMRGVELRGIDPNAEENVSDLPSQFRNGRIQDLRPGEFGIAREPTCL
jgi:lipoprotein-releasing system permease protein